jgi:hypothetical protein
MTRIALAALVAVQHGGIVGATVFVGFNDSRVSAELLSPKKRKIFVKLNVRPGRR